MSTRYTIHGCLSCLVSGHDQKEKIYEIKTLIFVHSFDGLFKVLVYIQFQEEIWGWAQNKSAQSVKTNLLFFQSRFQCSMRKTLVVSKQAYPVEASFIVNTLGTAAC